MTAPSFTEVKALLDKTVSQWREAHGREPDLAQHDPATFGWNDRAQLLAAEAFGNRLIEPELIGNGRGQETALVVALTEGVPGFPRMPNGGPFLPAEEIGIVTRWIDGGALEDAPGTDGGTTIRRFERVKEILETAVLGETIGAHGNFWRGIDLAGFIGLSVFGRKLVQPGSAADSHLVKALRGEAPFGRDVEPRPPGAIFRRMPAGRPMVDAESIGFIADWIDAGCPDDTVTPSAPVAMRPMMAASEAGTVGDPEAYIRFYREFDDFFLFQANPTTRNLIGTFFGATALWPGWTPDNTVEAWLTTVSETGMAEVVRALSASQIRILEGHFGSPPAAERLNEAYWLFGADRLPEDALRPREPRHRMDGATMWLVWLSFADACLRLGEAPATWETLARGIALGLVSDALQRTDRPPPERLQITRYQPGEETQAMVGADLAVLSGNALLVHNIGLGLEAMGTPATS
jgi:hypothetical protein